MPPKSNEKVFWESRYLQSNIPWDINQAAPAFVKYLNEQKNVREGKVGVLGCGYGHDAFYFAEHKNQKTKKSTFVVIGFDFAESAIKFCNNQKQEKKLENIFFYQANIFELIQDKKWENSFDYIIEHTSLCAIDPSRRKEYIELIKYVLKPSGKIIGLFFIRPKELSGPPFGSSVEEIRDLFKEDFIEVEKLYLEKCLHKGKLEGEEYFGIFEKK